MNDVSRQAGPGIVPFLGYEDAPAAIEWLEKAFGFSRRLVVPGDEGTIAHAELSFEDGFVMLGTEKGDDGFGMESPRSLGAVTGGIYVVVDEVDAHFERAQGAGAEIVRPPADTDYGAREYMARDPEGHLWSFGTYRPSLADQS